MPRVQEAEVIRQEQVFPRPLHVVFNLNLQIFRVRREAVELVPDEHHLAPVEHHVHWVDVEVEALGEGVGLAGVVGDDEL